MTSIEALERFEGHLFNWYDSSIAPLKPRYVSSVDSGTSRHRWLTLAPGCGRGSKASSCETAEIDASNPSLVARSRLLTA